MTTRAQRESYINTLILTDNQKNKFKNSNLNVNTIQNVVNALRGKGDRNVRINGILNSLSNGNRGPLNTLLRQNTQSARKQNTPTPTQNTTRPMNNTNRNALKRERPNKANNINKIYKYPNLHSVVPKTKANRNDNIGRARSKFDARVGGRSENAFNPILISDETLNSFINLVNDYNKFKNQLPKDFNRSRYEQILNHYKMICTRVKRYTYSDLTKTQLSFLRGLQLICAGGSQANTPNENVAFNNLQENKDKVYDILSLCSKDTFIKLSRQKTNNGSNASVRF